MKHSLIAFCMLSALSILSFMACSKKDLEVKTAPTMELTGDIPEEPADTPYGKTIKYLGATKPEKNVPAEIRTIPVAKRDTPYGK